MPTLWISGSTGLVPLESTGYASEGDFQELLAANPAVLANALDASMADVRWLLVDRELDIRPDGEADTVPWRLDHLFLTPDGMPVLVEVKRSSDPRARREVVAQMLDYAASFGTDWSADRLRQRLDARAVREGSDRDSEVEAFLAESAFDDEEAFWSEVDTRVSGGQIRLLFVADRLSSTLVRIIEYLNAQLRTAEVLGVEVVRHANCDESVVAYQPVVRGRTAAVPARKGRPGRRTREEFDSVLEARHGEKALAVVTDLVTRAEALGAYVSIGTGEKSPRLFLNFHTPTGRDIWPIAINPGIGKLVLFLRYLRNHPAFAEEPVRAELVTRMEEATGQAVQGDNLAGFPFLPVHVLSEPGVTDRILEVLRWAVSIASVPLTEAPQPAVAT